MKLATLLLPDVLSNVQENISVQDPYLTVLACKSIYCSLWFDQGHMHEENLKWTVIVNYWQSLTTPAIISSAALSYWHHKTVIIKLYHTLSIASCICITNPNCSYASLSMAEQRTYTMNEGCWMSHVMVAFQNYTFQNDVLDCSGRDVTPTCLLLIPLKCSAQEYPAKCEIIPR